MNVHFLTRTDTITLTRGVSFCQCGCVFHHGKTTHLFVIVGSRLSHSRLVWKKSDAPQRDSEQNLCFVASNYLLTLLWENKIPLYKSLVLTKSISLSEQRLSLFSFHYADHCHRAEVEEPSHKFESMTNFKLNQNTSHTHSLTPTRQHPNTHIHTSQLPSLSSKFEYSVQGQTACWDSVGGLLSKRDWKHADRHLGLGRKHFRLS